MHAVKGVVYASTQRDPRVLAEGEMRHKASAEQETGPANDGTFGLSQKRRYKYGSAGLARQALSRARGGAGHHKCDRSLGRGAVVGAGPPDARYRFFALFCSLSFTLYLAILWAIEGLQPPEIGRPSKYAGVLQDPHSLFSHHATDRLMILLTFIPQCLCLCLHHPAL